MPKCSVIGDGAMKPSVEFCLSEIEGIRRTNNKVWMQLVRLAIEYAPKEEVAAVFKDIEINDRRINDKWRLLLESLPS